MEKTAYGVLRLTPNQLDQHTPHSLQAAIQGHEEQEADREKRAWQRTRFLAFYIRNLWLEKPQGKPTDWFKFEWEKPTKKAQSTNTAADKELSAKFDKIAAQMFN